MYKLCMILIECIDGEPSLISPVKEHFYKYENRIWSRILISHTPSIKVILLTTWFLSLDKSMLYKVIENSKKFLKMKPL